MQPGDIHQAFEVDVISSVLHWPESSFEFEVNRNDASRPWIAADSDGNVIGFLIFWLIVDEAHLSNFGIHPNFRRQGIGEKLLTNALIHLWDEGARISFLEVRAGNIPAKSLYEKIGYQYVGVRKKYYQDNHEDALLMNLESINYSGLVQKVKSDQTNLNHSFFIIQ